LKVRRTVCNKAGVKEVIRKVKESCFNGTEVKGEVRKDFDALFKRLIVGKQKNSSYFEQI
jgi:hypothetical protein